jgi:hypothetical protein
VVICPEKDKIADLPGRKKRLFLPARCCNNAQKVLYFQTFFYGKRVAKIFPEW